MFSSTGTEDSIIRLTRTVPLDHLKFGGAGGGTWAELKGDDTKFPPIDTMKKAVLWCSPELYRQSVWSWLLEDSVPLVTSASKLDTQVGSICNVLVKTEFREERLLIGGLGPEQGFFCYCILRWHSDTLFHCVMVVGSLYLCHIGCTHSICSQYVVIFSLEKNYSGPE